MITPSQKALSVVEALEGQSDETKSEIFSRAVIVESTIRQAMSEGDVAYIQKSNGDRIELLLVG